MMEIIDPGRRRAAAIAVLRLSVFALFSIFTIAVGYRYGLGTGRVTLAALAVLVLGAFGLIYSGALVLAYSAIALGRASALFVKDGRVVVVSPVLWSRPIEQIRSANADSRALTIHLRNGGERRVPRQFFDQPVDTVARRLNGFLERPVS